VRGNLLATVLLPTRGRPDSLARSLESLESYVTYPEDVEIWIRVDNDDKATQDFLDARGRRKILVHRVVDFRGNGYADLHLMYNQLCQNAEGRFLFLWNDDALMLTNGWDRELVKHDDGKPCYLRSGISDGRGRDSHLFPIVHRSWYDTCGHFSMSPHNDTYIYNAFAPYPQLFRHTNITVRHNALEMLADTTSQEAQRWWPTTKKGWDSPEVQNALRSDITKLGELVKQNA
jgi:hypothetical protein